MTALIVDLLARGGYLGVVLLMALENVFPPIPSEVIMGLGGIAVAQGKMAIVPLVVAGTIGSTAGNYFWYAIGRRFGYLGLRPFVDRWGRWLTLDWRDVERLHTFFHRRGQWVVFVFRFMPAFRTIVSLPAGMAQMPRGRFLLATAAGTTIWNILLVEAGYWLGANFRVIDRYVGPATVALMVAIVLTYVWRVVRWQRP